MKWTLRGGFQWIKINNAIISIQENAFENVLWGMEAFCFDLIALSNTEVL